MSSTGRFLALVVAGVVSGAIGAAGGVTSLVSYSALLAVGVPALPADVANLVAGIACWPGSALTSRRELAGARPALARGLPVAAVGALTGALVLVGTPPGVFARVVPFLVALGSLALLLQPWLRAGGTSRALAWPLVGLVSVYGGYFGAGSGIMLLAVLLTLVDDRLPEANAIKNMLVGVTAVAASAVFVVAGPVDWTAVVPLAVGLFAGSTAGPVITRRVPAAVVRWVVAALGFTLAGQLWWHSA